MYPGDTETQWNRVINACRRPNVKVLFAINPNNGNDFTRQDVMAGVDRFHAEGIVVLGYVALGFGARSLTKVFDRISRMKSVYRCDGIMFDEAPTGAQYAGWMQQMAPLSWRQRNRPGHRQRVGCGLLYF